MHRARRIEVLVVLVFPAVSQRGRGRQAELDAGRAFSELLDVEGVTQPKVLRLCRGQLDTAEIERLTSARNVEEYLAEGFGRRRS